MPSSPRTASGGSLSARVRCSSSIPTPASPAMSCSTSTMRPPPAVRRPARSRRRRRGPLRQLHRPQRHDHDRRLRLRHQRSTRQPDSAADNRSPFGNHNGGALAIGPDGNLYIGVGDGGAADDPLNAGQDPDQILGSIVRIDPTPTEREPYAIPADNPYANGDGVPEIFAIGLRNPWRIAFDPMTNDLWVADVGQNRWRKSRFCSAPTAGAAATTSVATARGRRPCGRPAENNIDPVFVYPMETESPAAVRSRVARSTGFGDRPLRRLRVRRLLHLSDLGHLGSLR